jgi:predicted nucleotidyltransferase
VHTTLHGHLVAVCRAAGLEPPADSTITQVFKLLRREHLAFADFGPRGQDIERVLNSLAVIASEFDTIAGADAVVLFGSWAARYLGRPGRTPNDIDVLVIGDVDRDVVDDAAERAERRIGVPVQATVRTRLQWRSDRESFIREVRSRPIVVVLVADEESSFARELREVETRQVVVQ